MNTYIGIVIKFVCIEISYTYKHTMGEFGYAFFSRKKKTYFIKKSIWISDSLLLMKISKCEAKLVKTGSLI